jgi:hypothetical protein
LYYSKNAGYSLENLGHLLLITLGTIFTCGMFVFACFPELSAVASFKKNFMAPPSNVDKSAKAMRISGRMRIVLCLKEG